METLFFLGPHLCLGDAIHIHVLKGVEEVSVGHHALGCLPVHFLVASQDHYALTHSLHRCWRRGKGPEGRVPQVSA